MAQPPEKKLKTEEGAKNVETKPEERLRQQSSKESEEDAKTDTSPKIKDAVTFLTPDTTMNVLPSTVGNMLMSICDGGGLQYLIAGARANVGVKAGRYMFEAKIVEQMSPADDMGKKSTSMSRHAFRVGFCVAGGSLILGEDEDSIGFDNEGYLVTNKKKEKVCEPFVRDQMVAVVLNLDEKSPNFNTISFFREGQRACQPQLLPEALQGKALFPAVAFKNSTVHVNFSAAAVPLPFKCKGMQEASTKDAVVTKYAAPKDGKHEVLFPVSLPDEGSFDWLDLFLSKNPGYTEISERAICDWASKSGLYKIKARKISHDKPEISFGCPSLDDMLSVKKVLTQAASIQPRNFVVMEVKGNLVKESRVDALSKFKLPIFKTSAEVIIGEPTTELKNLAQKRTLEAKQEASDIDFKIRKGEEKRLWAVRKKAKDVAREMKRLEKEKKKKFEEMLRRQEAEKKKREKDLAREKKKAEKEARKKAKAAAKAAREAAKLVEAAAKAAEEAKAEEAKKAAEEAKKKEEEAKKTEEKTEDGKDGGAGKAEGSADGAQEKKENDEKKEEDAGEKKDVKEEERKEEEKVEKNGEDKKHEEKKEEEEKKEDEDSDEEEEEEPEKEEEEKENVVEVEDDDEPEEPDEPEPVDEDPPKVTLSEEELAQRFFKNPIPDLTPYVLNTSFMNFTTPTSDEGFDEVRYPWLKEKKCAEYFKDWILERKLTTRVEDIKPSEWFDNQWRRWNMVFQTWTAKQNEYKAQVAKKMAEKASKLARKAKEEAERKAREAELKARAEAEARAKEAMAAVAAASAQKEKEAAENAETKEGEKEGEEKKEEKPADDQQAPPAPPPPPAPPAPEAAPATAPAPPQAMEVEEPEKATEKEEENAKEKDREDEKEPEKEEEEEEEPEVDFAAIDIFGVEDVCDVGGGMPLFNNFGFEDFTMMCLRFELHLLAHAFRKDVTDPERTGIHLDHLGFYYQRYYKKNLNFKAFGVETARELVNMVNDTVYVKPSGIVDSQLPEDLESFAAFPKLAEEARRHRTLLVDMGQESAKLRIERNYPPSDNKGHDKSHKGFDGKGDKQHWKGDPKGDACFKGGFKNDFKGDKGDMFKGDMFKGGFKNDFKGDKGMQKGVKQDWSKGKGGKCGGCDGNWGKGGGKCGGCDGNWGKGGGKCGGADGNCGKAWGKKW